MAIKTIRFGINTEFTVADGPNGILLATLGPDGGTQKGLYADATVISGFRAGWVANPDFGLAVGAGITGDPKFGTGLVVRPVGTTTYVLRIERTPGTFPVILQTGMQQGGAAYITPRNRILDTSGAELFAQSGPSRNADGDSVPMQINTDGTKQLVGAADAGVSVTTTGSYWDIEIRPGTEFQNRLSFISFDDGVAGGGIPASVLRRRRRMASSSSFF